MPVVKHPGVLAAVYQEALRRIASHGIPSQFLPGNYTLFRAIDLRYVHLNASGVFPRQDANQGLLVRDQGKDVNRFTGQSFHATIPAAGGLYCSLQNQALVAEMVHYARQDPAIPRSGRNGFPSPAAAIGGKCVLRIRTMGSRIIADLSPHNPGAKAFVDAVEATAAVRDAIIAGRASRRPLWEQLFDGEDASVARGLGLAVASSRHFDGLAAATVRPSERDPAESGDNVVLFGTDGTQVPGLWVEKAYQFPLAGPVIEVPVA